MNDLEQGITDLLSKVAQQVKGNKEIAPIVGALIGLYLARDEEALNKILSGALGAGVGSVVKGLLEDSHGK